MTGERNLKQILKSLSPIVLPDVFVYSTVPSDFAMEWHKLTPLALIREAEGLTVILSQQVAQEQGWPFVGHYRCISLTVHSSLEAVGLTAAVSQALAEKHIPANMLAGYYHDHILVPVDSVDAAMAVLAELSA